MSGAQDKPIQGAGVRSPGSSQARGCPSPGRLRLPHDNYIPLWGFPAMGQEPDLQELLCTLKDSRKQVLGAMPGALSLISPPAPISIHLRRGVVSPVTREETEDRNPATWPLTSMLHQVPPPREGFGEHRR